MALLKDYLLLVANETSWTEIGVLATAAIGVSMRASLITRRPPHTQAAQQPVYLVQLVQQEAAAAQSAKVEKRNVKEAGTPPRSHILFRWSCNTRMEQEHSRDCFNILYYSIGTVLKAKKNYTMTQYIFVSFSFHVFLIKILSYITWKISIWNLKEPCQARSTKPVSAS